MPSFQVTELSSYRAAELSSCQAAELLIVVDEDKVHLMKLLFKTKMLVGVVVIGECDPFLMTTELFHAIIDDF